METGIAFTDTPDAAVPSEFRTTPDRTPDAPGGNAGCRIAIPPRDDKAAAVYLEKSMLSTVDPATIEIAFAEAIVFYALFLVK